MGATSITVYDLLRSRNTKKPMARSCFKGLSGTKCIYISIMKTSSLIKINFRLESVELIAKQRYNDFSAEKVTSK